MISIRRLKALVYKELLQIGRDPSSIVIAFVLPVLLLFIFGYGVSLDSRNVPIGVVVEQTGVHSNAFVSTLEASPYLKVVRAHNLNELKPLLWTEHLRGIVVLKGDFEKQLSTPQGVAPIQVITDGSDPQIASFVENFIKGAWYNWQELIKREAGNSQEALIQVESRFWYNPAVNSRFFLVPGSIAIILTVIGALLTALVIAREWERGTMEALLASPVARIELLLGKIIPYFLLGLVSFILCLFTAIFLFGVPMQGSFPVFLLVTSIFLLGALGLGLTISAATKNQFLASQMAVVIAFLPSLMLSGFIFEIRSMPLWIQWLTYLFPARYYVSCLQVLFLSGDNWTILLPNLLPLTLIACLFLMAVNRNLKRSLD